MWDDFERFCHEPGDWVSGSFKVTPPKSGIMTVTLLWVLGIKWGERADVKKINMLSGLC